MATIVDIIEAKRDGQHLTSAQLDDAVLGFVSGRYTDYQMSALLMAIYLNGMSIDETVALTASMIKSGDVMDLSSIPGRKFDKHSTGGVGDKVSLAFVPIIAAAGLTIAKMSGRGLGLTGGTLDKLESISGLRVSLTPDEIISQVRTIGACICAQTDRITPADKLIYALRDATGSVESIPLIASSVMSKKIACGADVILLDVKVGCGAFMKNIARARELAALMQQIGIAHGKTVIVEITSMDSPLGYAVGNLNEIVEVSDLLQGKPGEPHLRSLITGLAQTALTEAGSNETPDELIRSGRAWSKFVEIVQSQGGDISSIERWHDVSPIAQIRSERSGYVSEINAEKIGRSVMQLGAGRSRKDGVIDPLAGLTIRTSIGKYVEKGSLLADVFSRSQEFASIGVMGQILDAFTIGDRLPGPRTVNLEHFPRVPA